MRDSAHVPGQISSITSVESVRAGKETRMTLPRMRSAYARSSFSLLSATTASEPSGFTAAVISAWSSHRLKPARFAPGWM